MKNIGETLRTLREQHMLTQPQLAAKIGCTRQSISLYEKNKRRPDYETLEALADIFNVPISTFLTDQERADELNAIYSEYNRDDDEIMELRDRLRRQPGMRTLFKATKNATEEDLMRAVKIIEALKGANDD